MTCLDDLLSRKHSGKEKSENRDIESILKLGTVIGEMMGGCNTDEGQEGGEISTLGLGEPVTIKPWEATSRRQWYQRLQGTRAEGGRGTVHAGAKQAAL